MVKHYEGPIGCFDYDTNLWRLDDSFQRLNWIGSNQRCDLPKGVTSCKDMFSTLTLNEGFYFGDFDTSQVTDMTAMFYSCQLPKDFSLGDQFDTSNVEDMHNMFKYAKLPEQFSLGDKFIFNDSVYAEEMFYDCKLSRGFCLGENFRLLENTVMFKGCKFAKDFLSRNPMILEQWDAKAQRAFVGCSIFDETMGDYSYFIPYIESIISTMQKQYVFSRIFDVPKATLDNCKTLNEFLAIVDRYCKL